MKGNFTKDLYLIKRELIIAIFAEIFFIIIAALTRITGRDILPILKSDMALPLSLGAVLPPIILAETMMMDEKCDYMRYSLASPASRIGYVAEKYLFVIIISVIMSGLSVVFLLVAERPLFKSADYFLDMNPLVFISIGTLIQFFFDTAIISISVKSSALKMRTKLVVFIIIGPMIMGFLLGFVSGFTEASGNFKLEKAFYIGLGLALVIVWLWMFVTSFTCLKKKEL